MIRIKDLNPHLLKIDEKSNKNIDIFYIGYITIKHVDYVNIHSVDPLYFITDKADGYIEGKNGNKYLISLLQIKTKKYCQKTEIWDEIKYLIEKLMNHVIMEKKSWKSYLI